MRALQAAFALLMIALIAVACGGDSSETSETTEESGGASETAVNLVIESWRVEDTAVWEDSIIPAFEAANPGITLSFEPTTTPEYPAALSTRLEGGNAGDLITCRPFDDALALYNDGHLASINDVAGLDSFSGSALSAWQTLDGSDQFCLPMASVSHGFMYNMAIFDELGLTPPETQAEFDALLQTIADDGSYTPIAMGAASEDGWYPSTLLFQNFGPNYWKGEEGRLALVSGDAKFTDPEYIEVFDKMVEMSQYFPDGFEGVGYTDSQNLFALGQAAIFPAGSWEVNWANENTDFEVGVFRAPTESAGDTCYVDNHTDMGLGINAASPNQEAAATALEWFAGPEFAQLFTNSLPGFFALGQHAVSLDDPIASEYASGNLECETTIRNTYAVLNGGEPKLIDEMWRVVPLLLIGDVDSQGAAQQLEDGLASWYEPHAG